MSLVDLIYKVKLNLFDKNDTFDDFSDRLSFKFSCGVFMIASTVILFKQYFIRPISCYISNEAGGKYLIQYLENYCWVEGTIPLNFTERLPTNEKEWRNAEQNKLLYYQWVPFILGLQALMCYLPQLLWRLFYINNNGQGFDSLIDKANKAMVMDDDSRSKEVDHLAKILGNMLFESRDDETDKSCGIRYQIKKFYEFIILGKRLGAYLMLFYLFIKFLYLLNSMSQIFLMQALLCRVKSDCMFFGPKLLEDILNGKDWEAKSTFPRIGYCVAKLRNLGSTNFVVAQCSLPVNMLNEKIYILLWFWMLILSVFTLISIIIWICKLFLQYNKKKFLSKYLKISDACMYKDTNRIRTLIKKFEKMFLKQNGLFILRMIASNAGDIITAEIVTKLFATYKTKYLFKHPTFNEKRFSINPKDNSSIVLKISEKPKYKLTKSPNAPPLEDDIYN